jgi:hypothetical protein
MTGPNGSITGLRDLNGYEFGFSTTITPEAIESILAVAGKSAIDPTLDERLAAERCPACGRLRVEIPVGHWWGGSPTLGYRCNDSPDVETVVSSA